MSLFQGQTVVRYSLFSGEVVRYAKDAAGHEHDEKGLFTGNDSGGSDSKDKDNPTKVKDSSKPANKPMYEVGEDIANSHYKNMHAMLMRMQKGEYDPKDVLEDVEQYHDKAINNNARNINQRYNRWKEHAAKEYGDAALKSKEWKAVTEAYRKTREKVAEEIDTMSDVVRAYAKYHTEHPGEKIKIGRDDKDILSNHTNKLVDAYYSGTQQIGDALQAFLDKHGVAKHSKTERAILYAEFGDVVRYSGAHGGRWVTIGGRKDESSDEKHKGGFAVLLSEDGTILRGGDAALCPPLS